MNGKYLGFVIAVLLSVQCYAEIYRNVDARGNISFSDQPVVGAKKLEVTSPPYRYQVTVEHVIDGDTLVLEGGEKVRLIGINTPEIENRFHSAQAGGEQAKIWLENRLRLATLFIEYDEQQRDKYDRLLAHCFLEDGEYINASLLEQGLASLTLIPPNLRYADTLQQAQHVAEATKLGIWSMKAYQPKELGEITSLQHGQGWQRWQVKVTAIEPARRYVYLTLADNFRIQIPKANLALFPPLESYLQQEVEIRGWVSPKQQQYLITVLHPSAIILL